MPASLSGTCQCGNVRYTLAKAPEFAVACHCTECQKLSSGPLSVSLVVNRADLNVEGDLNRFDRPTESGGIARCFFCPTCSNRIYHDAGEDEKQVRLKGRLDDTSAIRPLLQVWTRSRQPWMGPVAGGLGALAGFSTQPDKSPMTYLRIALGRVWRYVRLVLQLLGLVLLVLWISGRL